MKKVWILILLVVAILAAYGVAYGVNPFKKLLGFGSPANPDNGATEKIPATTSTAGAVTGSGSGSFIPQVPVVQDKNGFPLSKGSTGKYVSMLQSALNSRFNSDLVVDGILGTKTAKALSANGFNPEAIYYRHFNEIVGYNYWV